MPLREPFAVTLLLWILVVFLMVVGILGTILPAVPGVTLIFGGVVLAAWIDHFTRIPVWLVVVCGVLTAATWVIDYTSAASGAKRLGASRLAVIGAFVGTFAGIFTGFWGLLFMPFAGAAIGRIHRTPRHRARRARGLRHVDGHRARERP